VCRWIRSNFFVAEMFYKFNDERFFGGEVERGLLGFRSLLEARVVKLFGGRLRECRIHDLHSDENLFL